MLAQNEMFKDAVSRLQKVYKDDTAKLEAVNVTAKIAMEAFGDISGLSGPIGTTQISTRPYHQTKFAPGTPTAMEPPTPVDPRAVQTSMLNWAKADPVACQRWINSTLNGAIERAAQQKFSNTLDDDGWQGAWKKALAGNANSDDAELKRAQEHAAQASAEKAKLDEKAERKAGMQYAKDMEREWRENQKRLGEEEKQRKKEEAKEASRQKHRDALDNMDFEDEIYNKAREYSYRDGRDPNMYKSTKDRSFLTNGLRGLRRWWHKKMADLNCAMGNGDMAMVESIKADLLKFQAFCESYGYTVDEVILG